MGHRKGSPEREVHSNTGLPKKDRNISNKQPNPPSPKKMDEQHSLLLEENINRKISDIPHSNIFTDASSMAREIKERINKWDYIKSKGFYTTKENIIKMKREPTIWENIFANDISDKGLISKIYKELK